MKRFGSWSFFELKNIMNQIFFFPAICFPKEGGEANTWKNNWLQNQELQKLKSRPVVWGS